MRSSLSIQCLPLSGADKKEVYRLVDQAIEVIDQSGLDYTVSPFETTIEGDLEEVWKVALRAHKAVLEAMGPRPRVMSMVKVLSGEEVGSAEEKMARHGECSEGE
ncbi:MAG: thiamine-binding protein [Candidatus Bipolaricaulota bacterium]